MASSLNTNQCVLAAVDFACEANIAALESLKHSRPDALDTNLLLQILLTFLPESTPATEYGPFVQRCCDGSTVQSDDYSIPNLDTYQNIPTKLAHRRVKDLDLLDLRPANLPDYAPSNALTAFVYHRAYRIDAETGLVHLVAQVVEPFAASNTFLHAWYLGSILPLVLLQRDGFSDDALRMSLASFEGLDAEASAQLLLARLEPTSRDASRSDQAARTRHVCTTLIAPWLYGNTWQHDARHAISGTQKTSSDSVGDNAYWDAFSKWLYRQATQDWPTFVQVGTAWDGPGDADFGTVDPPAAFPDSKLNEQYDCLLYACCYTVEAGDKETLQGIYEVLQKLGLRSGYQRLPALDTNVAELGPPSDGVHDILNSLPRNSADANTLLQANHALSSPGPSSFAIIKMLVLSAYQFNNLGHPISVAQALKLKLDGDSTAQEDILHQILRAIVLKGRCDDSLWMSLSESLRWLWHWNSNNSKDSILQTGYGPLGSVPHDKLEEEILKAMLNTANYILVEELYTTREQRTSRLTDDKIESTILNEAMQFYDLSTNGNRTRGSMKKCSDIINAFKHVYADRVDFKAASSLLTATHALSFYALTLEQGVPFKPASIRQSSDPLGLVIPKVLEQNPRAYTKLDDLIAIGQNLMSSTDAGHEASDKNRASQTTRSNMAERRVVYICIEAALREDDFDTAYSYLVNRLAPELPKSKDSANDLTLDHEDEAQNPSLDDISWRAAFLAGRFRPQTESKTAQQRIRRLEQRTELLALALLFAPQENLSEILNVFRRCEEELTTLLTQQAKADEAHNDSARRRNHPLNSRHHQHPSTTPMPGIWADPSTEGMVFGQQTRELGRLASSVNPVLQHEARRPSTARPASGDDYEYGTEAESQLGLFDVARGAARAFKRNAFPLRPTSSSSLPARSVRGTERSSSLNASPVLKSEQNVKDKRHVSAMQSATDVEDEEQDAWGGEDDWPEDDEGDRDAKFTHGEQGQRVRTRDVVASAVTGKLASGLGWVLGATPLDQESDHGR